MRWARAMTAALAVGAVAPAAHAMGAIATSAGGSVTVREARVAYADGGDFGTLWAELRLTGSASSLAWIVPVRDGTAIDQGSSALFDALEDGTAPRIGLPTSGPSGVANGCEKPSYPETDTMGDAEPELHPSDAAQVESAADVRATLASWNVADTTGDRLDAAQAAGFRFFLLRFSPSNQAFSTITLRLHGSNVAALPLAMTGGDDATRLTAWLVGDSHLVVQGVTPHQAPVPTWISATGTDYASRRDQILAGEPEAWLAEVSGTTELVSSTVVGNGTIAPSVVDAYLRRASERGEMTFSLEKGTSQVHGALGTGADLNEPCGRGDLGIVGGYDCKEDGDNPLALAGSDDLAFLFGGQGPRFVTRYAARLGAGTRGKTHALASSGSDVLPVVIPGKSDPNGCGATGAGGSTSTGAGKSGGDGSSHPVGSGSSGSGHLGSSSGSSTGSTGSSSSGSGDDGGGVEINVGINYDSDPAYPPSSGGDSCSKDDDSGDHDSCSKDDDGSSSDSCAKDDDGGSSDSCGSGSSGGDSCSGGGDSCSGGSSDCSVGAHGKRHVRLSPILVGLVAVGFATRRAGRRRNG